MGGAKTKKKAPPKKKKATVPKMFKCPFCNHDESCEVKLDRAADNGAISCRICGETFQCRITYMSDPVDVFCEWVDELERARSGGAIAGGSGDSGAAGGAGAPSGSGGGGGGDDAAGADD